MPIPNSGQISLNDDINSTLQADTNESDVSLGDNNEVKFTEVADGDTITGRSMSELRGQTLFEVFPSNEADGALGESLHLDGPTSNHNHLIINEPAGTAAASYLARKGTFSFWVKEHGEAHTNHNTLYSSGTGSGSTNRIWIRKNTSSSNLDDKILVAINSSSYISDAVNLDKNGWYHYVFAIDTTQPTNNLRVRCWVNGIELSWGTVGSVTQNSNLYFGYKQEINEIFWNSGYGLDATYADFKYIDGSALLPNQFGELKDGIWVPKAYAKKSNDTLVTTNLIASYDFNGNVNDISGSATTYNATASNITYAINNYGVGVFNGLETSSRTKVDTGISNLHTNFAVSFWFNVDAKSQGDVIIGTTDSYDNSGGFGAHLQSTSEISVFFATGSGSSQKSNIKKDAGITTGSWHHLTIVQENNVSKRVYINGELIGTNTESYYANVSPRNLLLGGYSAYNNSSFDGKYGELQVYNAALTDAQVKQNYNATKHKYAYGLNGFHLPLNNSDTGEIVTDSLEIHLDAGDHDGDGADETTYSGSAWNDITSNNNDFTSDSGETPSWSSTNGGYFDFDGSNDNFYTSSGVSLENNFTIEAWVNSDANDTQFIASDYDTSATQSFNFFFRYNATNRVFQLYAREGSTSRIVQYSLSDFRTGWTHWVGVQEYGNAMKLYRDGALVASASNTADIESNTGDNKITVGIYGQGNATSQFDGKIAQVRIYNKALTAQEVVQNYRATQGHYKVLSKVDISGNAKKVVAGGSNLTAAAHTNSEPSDNYTTFDVNNFFGTGSPTLTEGNKIYKSGSSAEGFAATNISLPRNSGKWYWEIKSLEGTGHGSFGITDTTQFSPRDAGQYNPFDQGVSFGILTRSDNLAHIYKNGTETVANAFTLNTSEGVLALAIDTDADKYWLGVASGGSVTWYNSGNPASGTNATDNGLDWPNYTPYVSNFSGSSGRYQNAQLLVEPSELVGAAPTGFKLLSFNNLPSAEFDPVDKEQAADHFDVITYSGTSELNSITGLEFKPDLVWLKQLNSAENHGIFDSVRGANNFIMSNSTAANNTRSTDTLSSFDDNGFTVTGYNSDDFINYQGREMVAWCWKAGGEAVSNTDGSITSQVSANQDAGFSIVSYTTTPSVSDTIGHGLSVAPELIITKALNNASAHWWTYSSTVGTGKYLELSSSDAPAPYSDIFNSVTTDAFQYKPSSASYNYIAYCFHSVNGFSKIGSYEGNANANGPFVYTGFKPKFVMIKNIDDIGNWVVHDTLRNTSNKSTKHLRFNTNDDTETGSGEYIEFHSNGFKLAGTGQDINHAETYIYMAFAEDPAKYSQGFGKTGNATEKFLDTDGSSSKKTEYPEEHFNTVLWTGNGVNGRFIETGLKPGLVWIKNRSTSSVSNVLYDSIRGVGLNKMLHSDLNVEEGNTTPGDDSLYGHLSSINQSGFTVQAGSTNANFVNQSSSNYVAWNWKAGDSNVEKKPTYTESGIYATNLALHYNFANDNTYSGSGTTVYDLTSNDNDGTLYNSPTWRTNAYGNYFEFDGSNDYIDTGYTQAAGSAATFEFWVEPKNESQRHVILGSLDSGGANTSGILLEISNSNLLRYIIGTGTTSHRLDDDDCPVVTKGVWTHIVVTHSGTAVKFYVNGLEQTSYTSPINFTNLARQRSYKLGTFNSSSSSHLFDGKFGQARIYTSALTEAQIRANYNATKTLYQGLGTTADVVQTNLKLSYDVDDFDTYTSGSTVYDKTSNDNDGTIVGATLGKSHVGKYLDFDGSNDYISSGLSTALGTGDFSIECWINQDNHDNWTMIWGDQYYGSTTAYGLGYYIRNGYFAVWGEGTNNAAYEILAYDDPHNVRMNADSWNHLVVTRSGGTFKGYINGILAISSTSSSLDQNYSATNAFIMRHYNTNDYYVNGKLAQFRIYGKELSNAEIKANYDATKAQFYSPLIHSTVSVNDKAGFSIASYNAIGAAGSVSHGMTGDSELVLIKNRDQADDWAVYNKFTGATKFLELNEHFGAAPSIDMFNNSDFTNNTFNIATNHQTGAANENYISYHFRSIPGYSKIGIYIGNGSTTGPTIITGFRPRLVLIKRTDGNGNWSLYDIERDSTNPVATNMILNSNGADNIAPLGIDFNDDNFQLKANYTSVNNNNLSYLYLAIAR